jgi:hypothetical protein
MAVLALFAVAWGCGSDKTVPTGPSTPPDPSATFSRVQREIFAPSCALAGCHVGASPQVALSLEVGRAYASLVGVGSAETSLLRVAPSLPNDSYLVVKLRGDASILGARMPSGGSPLSSQQLQLVVDWVRRGAPND